MTDLIDLSPELGGGPSICQSALPDVLVPGSAGANRAGRWFVVADGRRLQALRRQRGLSQVMLAGRAGISLGTVSRLDLLTEQDREFPQFSGWVAGSGGTFSGHDRRW